LCARVCDYRVLKAEQGLKLRTVRLIELRDDGVGLEAFVVIDHDLFPVSAGGTRMLPDVDLEEVTRLARAMTWKHAAFHLPYAGAKAGVRFASGNREALLAAYKLALKPYSEIFLTGPDMGTFPADFIEDSDDPAPLWALSHEGLGMDDLATGHGVKAAAEAGLAHLARTLEGATVAVEGVGKVGAGTARACARAGARLVGVSTVHGLVTDSTGLDVEDLLTLRERHGDRFVEHASSKVRPREALFELECDVLVPGARPHSITAGVAQRLRCAVVSPAANVPYGAGSLDVLHQRGIVAVPDFMSNGGGNFLYELDQDKGPAEALAAIEVLVHERVVRVLATAEDLRITPYAGALRDARNYVAQATDASAEILDELFSI
jgi:glutamate dehydrogenase/leucine dehydrogenase